jgi:alcohol dehydrogenase class IV
MAFTYGVPHLQPAFSDREVPKISYGLAFDELCAHHVKDTVDCTRTYIIASKSLSTNTDSLTRLQNALGDKVVGIRIGMSAHTHWNEVLAITKEARPLSIDCIITLGAGSLTDAAKVICWMLANDITTTEGMETLLSKNPKSKNAKAPTVTHIAIPTSLSGGEYQAIAGVTRAHDTGAKVLVSLSSPTL